MVSCVFGPASPSSLKAYDLEMERHIPPKGLPNPIFPENYRPGPIGILLL